MFNTSCSTDGTGRTRNALSILVNKFLGISGQRQNEMTEYLFRKPESISIVNQMLDGNRSQFDEFVTSFYNNVHTDPELEQIWKSSSKSNPNLDNIWEEISEIKKTEDRISAKRAKVVDYDFEKPDFLWPVSLFAPSEEELGDLAELSEKLTEDIASGRFKGENLDYKKAFLKKTREKMTELEKTLLPAPRLFGKKRRSRKGRKSRRSRKGRRSRRSRRSHRSRRSRRSRR